VGHLPDCALGWAVDDLLTRRDIAVRRRRANSPSDGVRAMALAGMGVAWLPQGGTQHERSAGILVRAGDPSFDIPLDIVAIRPRHPLSRLAESLWRLLADGEPLASAVPEPAPWLNRGSDASYASVVAVSSLVKHANHR